MDRWQDDFVTANGIQLHYWRTGGDKPPLVLCHGITDNGLCWRRAAQVLAADFDLIMVDARGHGLSGRSQAGYSADDHADDVAALIEALSLERPRAMGHSMGANTVSLMAFKRPELVSTIVLEDPGWRELTPELEEANHQRLSEWRIVTEKRQGSTTEQIVAEGYEEHPGWAEVEFGPWAMAKQQVDPNVLSYRYRSINQWKEAAAGLSVPTLLVTADPALGAIVTPAMAQALSDANAHIQVQQIEGAGHNIRREQFDPFVKTVRDFLAA